MPPPVKIGFALLSAAHDPLPSTRIACLNLFPHLQQAGFEPRIVFQPRSPTEQPRIDPFLADQVADAGIGTVILQKIHGPFVLDFVTALRIKGIRVLYLVCDLIDNAMCAACDTTVVVTDYLRSLYARELQSKIHIIHDGIEHPEFHKPLSHHEDKRRLLRLGLVTSQPLLHMPVLKYPPAGWTLQIIGPYPPTHHLWERLRQLRHGLAEPDRPPLMDILLSALHPAIRRCPWSPMGVYKSLLRVDVGIIPIDTAQQGADGLPPPWRRKSENRLTLLMALGLPVVATPIPAYEALIRQGENGFLARSRRDWRRTLGELRDPERRRIVGQAARQSVIEPYSQQAQARQLIKLLSLPSGDSGKPA
ncbi:MAG: glycosyltransferase [Candidatus Competibacteraceae bacterium]|nr:glycosyltransferase [Candidatus Competibacteraceae bacterium]